jgi:hypothetical protein
LSAETEVVNEKNEIQQPDSIKEPFVVDLQGAIDWKQKLFGLLSLETDEIKWQKSEFCQKIEEGHKRFKIINISKEAKKDFEQEMDIARAYGVYQYYGYKLKTEFEIIFVENDLDFSKFFDDKNSDQPSNKFKVSYKNNSTSKYLPADCSVVNGYSFDFLIRKKVTFE